VKRTLLLGVVLAACGSGEQQIVIVLEGDVTASSYEIILVEPHVRLKRNQRSNEPGGKETAFYVVQRQRVDVGFDEPTPLAGIELALVGADFALPIIKAFDEQGALIGMGILDPGRVFADDGNSEDNFTNHLAAIEDITRFPITVEAVVVEPTSANPPRPQPVREGGVMLVSCPPRPGISGLAWRPSASPDYETGQLRIVLPVDGTVDALARVEEEGLDLDCDQHTPRLRGIVPTGDEADCDDTSSLVFGGSQATETCTDGIDTDCDSSTIGVDVAVNQCPSCLGNQLTCVEGSNAIEGDGCADIATCLACPVVTRPIDGGGLVEVCSNRGEITLPVACGTGCVARLVAVDPRWQVRIGDVDDPKAGLLQGHVVVGGKIGIAVEQSASSTVSGVDVSGIAIAVQSAPDAPIQLIEVKLVVDQNIQTAACRPVEQMPGCRAET